MGGGVRSRGRRPRDGRRGERHEAVGVPQGRAHVALLLDARRPDADAVVVLRCDRLGRDAATLNLFKRFHAGRVGLVSVAEHFDFATPHGRAMAQVGAVFAKLERALIAARPPRR